MMVFDGIIELFRNKRVEAPVAPSVNLEELKQHEANLNTIITQGGKDSTHPADANALREVRNKIAAIEGQQTPPTPQTTPLEQPGITQMPVEQPQQVPIVEEPKAA